MKIKLLVAFVTILSMALLAQELPIDGNFSQNNPDGTSSSWALHPWQGFQPFATIQVNTSGEFNSLTVNNVEAESGTCIRTLKRFPGRSGDEVKISLRAKGRGVAGVQLHYFTAQGGWLQSSLSRKFPLTNEWKEQLLSFTVNNGTTGETGAFHICLIGEKGMQGEFATISASLNEGKYRGEQALPTQWQVFAPISKNFQPSAEELNSIPAVLDQQVGEKATLVANQLDMAVFMGAGAEKCAWVFAEFESPIACDWTLGAGADWWMIVYLNGEKLIDTTENGNQKSPLNINNHIAQVRLKPGRNILSAKIITGRASSILMLGGSLDLRKLVTRVKMSGIRWIENFDSETVTCSGNPELIQGNPTPGLLSVTGQGVFRTGNQININPQEQTLTFPPAEKQYLATSIRIQNFGREENSRVNAELDVIFKAGDAEFRFRLIHQADNEQLLLKTIADIPNPKELSIPYKILPADFIFAATPDGDYAVAVNSLADSSSRVFRGEAAFFKIHQAFTTGMIFRSTAEKEAEIVVDNFIIGAAADESKTSSTPFRNRLSKTFDPVKEHWKAIFSDDFDGDSVDLEKWYFSYSSRPDYITVKEGLAHIKADWKDDGSRLESASLYTYQDFLFGYFETRVRFRKEHGWWSAFWLCTENPSNPFVDGFEIDIFEDYYLRSIVPGGTPRDILDHNLHINAGGTLKSWNYHSKLPGSLEDFYVIGCKWTPFEISYYLNGNLMASSANHSPYDSVTFDPFNHGAGITPLKAILSGCVGRSGGDPKDGNFPEEFLIDYVRIYEYPRDREPQIRMLEQPETDFTVQNGTILTFEVDVKPSPNSKASIETVYLFDSGFLLDYKRKPPYRFEVMLTKEYYETSNYCKPGRSGKRLEFAPTLHAFSIFAQDTEGQTAFTEPILKLLRSSQESTPYQGKPQRIPGILSLTGYDDGGPFVAYFDTTEANTIDKSKTFRPDEGVDAGETVVGGIFPWEWMNYTVEVEKTGTYTAKISYGTPLLNRRGFLLLVNHNPAGEFPVLTHKQELGFGVTSISEVKGIKLQAGRNLLTLIAQSGGINIRDIEFCEQ